MHAVRKKEILFGYAVGAFFMFLLNSYIIASDPLGQCAKLTEDQTPNFNATKQEDPPASKSQVILPRENCTTEVHNAANVKLVNDKIQINGTWPYNNPSEVCAGKNSEKCMPAFIEYNEKPTIYTSSTSKTGFCMNYKSSSQLIASVACLLDDPLKFFYGENDLVKNALKRPCGDTNLYRSLKDAQDKGITQENGWKMAMVVRNPLERFVSGFIFLCINICSHSCNQCGVDINCYLDRQVKKFEKMMELKKSFTVETDHLFPQNWACDLRNNLANYTFVKFNSDSAKFFDEGLGPFFRAQNVSDQALTYIRNRLTATRTEHSNPDQDLSTYLQNKIRSSPVMLEKFLRIFYHDYTTFNFPFPELIK